VQLPVHLAGGVAATCVHGDRADESAQRPAHDGARGRVGPGGDAHDGWDADAVAGLRAHGLGRGPAGTARAAAS
jgi:hypothetical protein